MNQPNSETDLTTMETSAAVAASLVQDLGGQELIDVEDPNAPGKDIPIAVMPRGLRLESFKRYIDEYRTQPERREGTAAHRTLDSLILHANRFKDADSALFAVPDQNNPRIIAVLDYHRAGGDGAPRFCKHRGSLTLELSEAWKAWTAQAGKPMDVSAFSEFLEQRVEDIVDPAGLAPDSPTKLLADKLQVAFATPPMMLAVARGLQIRVTQDVSDIKNLETGEVNLQFEEKHEAKGGLRAPAAFCIALQVFRGGNPYYVAARLRYRLMNGKLFWFIELYRTDKVFDLAFEESCTKAQAETKLPLFVGTPE